MGLGKAMRMALLRWQLIAVPVLPLWLLVGFGVFGGGPSGLFVLLLAAGVLFAFLAVIAGLTRARPAVREQRAPGVWDALATIAWHLAIVGLGFFGTTGIAFGIAAIVLGLLVFWMTVAQLVREWRERVSDALAQASAGPAPYRPVRKPPEDGDGDVIIVHETGR